jgi:nitroimidazol reductase NimA-like FMN-containing flavoprotein (pyridoxamine 5'-phosphate oxidase superfamily)
MTAAPHVPRTRIRRLPDKAVSDRATMYAVVDAGLVAHVGIAVAGQPFVMPCGYARDDNQLLLHGSTGSRLFRALASGVPACVTITILDGLVVATSLFESSMHYRCAVILGRGTSLIGAEKKGALDILADALLPGRRADARPPNKRELAATTVVSIPMDEWSLKVSDSPPETVPDDAGWAPWSGVVPLQLRPGAPITEFGGTAPSYVTGWHKGRRTR